MNIEIYTDGSARGTTPNYYGGWGMVVIKDGEKILEKSGGKFPATNNEMELTAILKAIEYIEDIYIFGCNYTIYTDSNYSLQSVTTWCHNWVKNDWRNSKKETVANKEIIQNIYYKLLKKSDIKIKKVKGHSNNEWNNYADGLAADYSAILQKKAWEDKYE